MGTRSITRIIEEEKELLTIYCQYDGYPSGMGEDLKEFLAPFSVVNGYNSTVNIANGMGCLAAQLIAHLKDGTGNVYIYPVGSNDCGEEFEYIISLRNGAINLKCIGVWDNNKVIYDGAINNFTYNN